jgi:hypothetical protein
MGRARQVLNRSAGVLLPLAATLVLPLLLQHPAAAETYSWTDSGGNTFFTDDPATIPRHYRHKVTTGDDITLADPAVRQEVEESRLTAARLEQETQRKNRQTRRKELAQESEQKLQAEREKRLAEATVHKAQPVRKRAFG